jgi:hypothetical protein
MHSVLLLMLQLPIVFVLYIMELVQPIILVLLLEISLEQRLDTAISQQNQQLQLILIALVRLVVMLQSLQILITLLLLTAGSHVINPVKILLLMDVDGSLLMIRTSVRNIVQFVVKLILALELKMFGQSQASTKLHLLQLVNVLIKKLITRIQLLQDIVRLCPISLHQEMIPQRLNVRVERIAEYLYSLNSNA